MPKAFVLGAAFPVLCTIGFAAGRFCSRVQGLAALRRCPGAKAARPLQQAGAVAPGGIETVVFSPTFVF